MYSHLVVIIVNMLDVLPYPLEKCASSSGLVVKKTGAFSNPQLPRLLILVLLPRMLNRRWSVSIKTEEKNTKHTVLQNNQTSKVQLDFYNVTS